MGDNTHGRAAVRIRAAQPEDADGIARVSVVSWQATYRHLLPQEVLAALSIERSAANYRALLTEPGASCAFVAESDAGIVAFAVGGPERSGDEEYPGELYAIYALPEWQGRGLGRALVRLVALYLQSIGFKAMLIWVLRGNPAAGFYRALGGEAARTQMIEIGGRSHQEIGYGWKNLSVLAAEGTAVRSSDGKS